MNKRVSLREIVANKIVYALILVSYYWMWARTDWKDWYQIVQSSLGVFFIVFFVYQSMRIRKYKQECFDEMAEQNLKRCDSICLKILTVVLVIIAWGSAILGHVNAISGEVTGGAIVLSLLVISVIRTVIFVIMDSKGV